MFDSSSKEKILRRIRKALSNKSLNPSPKVDVDSDIYVTSTELIEVIFAEQLKKNHGQFVFCEKPDDLQDSLKELIVRKKWKNVFCWDDEIKPYLNKAQIDFISDDLNLNSIEAGITSCEFLVARTGSILVSSRQGAGRRLTIFPPVHIVIANVSQLAYDMKEAIRNIKRKYSNDLPSMISAISGPSRTADIEKTLVLGAHGPKELIVFLLDKRA